jgi:putative polyhydroxyalkanoate system protein
MTLLDLSFDHALGLARAKVLAQQWVHAAQEKFKISCVHDPGWDQDKITFERTGLYGELLVKACQFRLTLHLGFALSPFAHKIECSLRQNLAADLAHLQ